MEVTPQTWLCNLDIFGSWPSGGQPTPQDIENEVKQALLNEADLTVPILWKL